MAALAFGLGLGLLGLRAQSNPGASGPSMFGPALPPDFYGKLPDPFPPNPKIEGVSRLGLVYTTNLVGETDPCG